MEWADGFWFKVIFVIGVIIAQGVLWSWALLRKRAVAPDVKVFNFRELFEQAKASIESFYARQGR